MPLTYPANYQWPEILQRLGAWGGLGNSARDAEGQIIIDAYTVVDAKAWLKSQIATFARNYQDEFLKRLNYSAGEASTWSLKQSQAAAYLAKGVAAANTDAPLLAAEATAAGVTTATVVARVNTNAATFSAWTAAVCGNRLKHQNAVDALTTFDQVAAYSYGTGWPALP